ncbi:DNA helicase PriA [Sporanaerobium hydrogeniformans]|uniref:DNA helicase PriA n=1 Tax=Sporanaerobium hydrogeniformans TaxID=3072179 RepID=A0AC61DFY3_9FIRM|nr:zinc ribbon domain-containing protein [Sporanaerobium hydrogeniformans]PHV71943.1 DNA helicase PriA [Sporanaerobium hydrogeniformans]
MAEVKAYKCLSCKAGLEFDPASQKWKCHYCFSSFEKAELDAVYGKEEEKQEETLKESKVLDSYFCSNCGAELIADETTAATFCVYCKSPSIIKRRFEGEFKPRYVIPFKLTYEQAKEIYQSWMKKHVLAPTHFKRKEEVDKITGIYVPFWLFNSQVKGNIVGEGTKIRTWYQGDYQYTQTKYYEVEREGYSEYEKVPIDGSQKLEDALMEKIEPYEYKDLKDFNSAYISGFMAERYDVDSQKAQSSMENRVKQYMSSRLEATITEYNTFIPHSTNYEVKKRESSYAMMPLYILVNEYKGKMHEFVINGQTGKVAGNTPISFKNQLLYGASIFFFSVLILVLGGAFFV